MSDGWAGQEERLGAGQGWRLAPGAGLRAERVGTKDRGMRGFAEYDGCHCCVTEPCEG